SQSPKAAPSDAETQIGQKFKPLWPIKAPIATSAPQAGMRSEINASDSPNASPKTTGTAQPPLLRTNSTTCWATAWRSIGKASGPGDGTCLSPARADAPAPLVRQVRLILRKEMANHNQRDDKKRNGKKSTDESPEPGPEHQRQEDGERIE